MTKLGESLLQSLSEARAIARGDIAPARAFSVDALAVAAIRKRLGVAEGDTRRKILPPNKIAAEKAKGHCKKRT